MKATKTFKIGEYCKGGVITAKVQGTHVTIIGKDWDFSQGSKRGSNQSNAQEFTRIEVNIEERGSTSELSNFLHDLTTSYYTDQVMEWVESKLGLPSKLWW